MSGASPARVTTPAVSIAERPYQRLAAQILGLLAERGFPVGARLPSERALAERFGVSRTSLREAIIALELQGAVEVRGGSGIYVCHAPAGGSKDAALAFMPEAGPGPFELLRARSLIESEVAALAAASRQDADLDRIFAALIEMREQMNDKDANQAADRRFHLGIAEATGNTVLLQVVTALWDQARSPVWARIDAHFHSPALREASQADHQRVFKALVDGDATGARAAMRAHLDRVIAEFAQAWR